MRLRVRKWQHQESDALTSSTSTRFCQPKGGCTWDEMEGFDEWRFSFSWILTEYKRCRICQLCWMLINVPINYNKCTVRIHLYSVAEAPVFGCCDVKYSSILHLYPLKKNYLKDSMQTRITLKTLVKSTESWRPANEPWIVCFFRTLWFLKSGTDDRQTDSQQKTTGSVSFISHIYHTVMY